MAVKTRVGVIGLGMGVHHVREYQKVAGCEVTALSDVDAERLGKSAAEFKVPHTFADGLELIHSGKVDAVSVATPNTLHHPLTVAALRAGLHVLCEKPMAMNAAQAQEMVDEAKKADRRLAIHYNHRANASVQWIARFARAGELGEIYFARTIWHRRRGIPGRPSFLQMKNSGGGGLIDLGVHMLDQTLYIMGFPKVVSVTAATHTKFDQLDVPNIPMDVDDFATAYLRFEGGATLELEISWASHHHHAEELGVQVYGTKGGARRLTQDYKETAVEVYRRDHGGLSTVRMDQPPRDLVSVQADFIAAIAEERTPAFSGEQGLVAMRVLDAIYESSRLGREVVLK